jgi:hypothetical protein
VSPRPTSANRCGARHVVNGTVYVCERTDGHQGKHSQGRAHRWGPSRQVETPPLGVSCADLPPDPPLNARPPIFEIGRRARRPRTGAPPSR